VKIQNTFYFMFLNFRSYSFCQRKWCWFCRTKCDSWMVWDRRNKGQRGKTL